jgi:hypothetical protein
MTPAGSEPKMATIDRSRRRLLAATTVLLSSLVALAIAEVAVRLSGHTPRVPIAKPEPPIHAPDPVLGWKPIPGEYVFGPYSPGAAPVDVTILANGSRDTGGGPPDGRPEVLLVGDSFTMGWAVSDDETWAWRLQELRPDVDVVNRGVGGYGTLQSLMVLERILDGDGPRPAWVLYGFIDHGWRNVAAPYWLWALSLNQRTVATPYATIGPDGALQRHAPEAYPSLPLHGSLASVALLEDAWMRRRADGRQKMAAPVTKLLLSDMAARSRAAGVGFSLVMLNVPDKIEKVYGEYARGNQIDVIDCDQQFGLQDIVPGEVHPNGPAHKRWGDCIAKALSDPQRLPPRKRG